MSKPEVGQVWERDNKRREVCSVTPPKVGYDVWWRRPGSKLTRCCWCTTWEEWASKATLVEPKQ